VTTRRPPTRKPHAALEARTPTEIEAYRAMLKEQAAEFLARRAKIAMAYGEQMERERLDGPDVVNCQGVLPGVQGAATPSLEDQIAARTETVFGAKPPPGTVKQ
jgi:hypothetical protein